MPHFRTRLVLEPDESGRTALLVLPLYYESAIVGSLIVPEGFRTDGASVPRLFWNLIPPWGRYGAAAVVHDYLYRKQEFARATADAVLLEAMEACGVGFLTRKTIYSAVRLFGWAAWREDGNAIEKGAV